MRKLKNVTPTRAAQMWCELNVWMIPPEIKKIKSQHEAWGIMRGLELRCSHESIKRAWAKAHWRKFKKPLAKYGLEPL